MIKIIGIIGGDPESINSEIIAKTWKQKNKFRNLNIVSHISVGRNILFYYYGF